MCLVRPDRRVSTEFWRNRLEQMSPERRKTLEENQDLLRGARDYLKTLKARVELGILSFRFSSMPSVAESDALQKFRKSQYSAFSQEPDRIPEMLDRVLAEFGMTAVFRGDRIDILGGIELEIQYSPPPPLSRVPDGRGLG